MLSGQEPQGKGTRPVFTQKPAIRQAGDKIIIECSLTADPAPNLTWYHGNNVINAGGRYKIIFTGNGPAYNVGLEIDKVGVNDGGDYKVLAKNSAGEANANITLNFEGRCSLYPYW